MKTRKNMQGGSGTLCRSCSCSGSKQLCAVHTLWDTFFEDLPVGVQPWADVKPGLALKRLRKLLVALGIMNAQEYGTHSFRRGHADDMRKCGCTLAEILRAGQWKSAAFLAYIDEADLGKDVALAVAIESEDEEWID